MPTKIVSSKSNPEKGEINQHDLVRISQDFENFVDINSSVSRIFRKLHVVSIPISIVKNLLEKYNLGEDDNACLNVRFGITLPNQKDCIDKKIDASNYLTTLLFVEKAGVEQDGIGDSVIVPGFKEFNDNINLVRVCCPVIKPGS